MSFGRTCAALLAALCLALTAPGTASAAGTRQPTPVSGSVSAATPNVLDGTVFTIAQVGDTVLLGGNFASAANPGSTTAVTDPERGKYIVAFDAVSGRINTAFAPALDGQVRKLLPGPTPGTVYVGGYFTTVGGVRAKGLVLLDVATGARVPGFAAIPMNGVVTSLARTGNRLFVGGTFTTFGGAARGGIASVDATTGALEAFVQSTVLTNHNWVEGSTDAKAAVGVFGLDVTPAGDRLIAIGNFKTVDGLPRDQVAMFDLTGDRATVRPDWRTRGYEPKCYSWSYDTYVRDAQFSPDGEYFVVATTGGGSTTLCDTAARFETAGSGDDVKPTWVNFSGGDSYLSVAVTGAAVYVGGHQRWMNNALATDRARGGAVARPGLGALEPSTGIPLSWNPGRNPRGAGAYALLAAANGLYVGSDTDYVGNFQHRRMKVAYFPLAGGTALPSTRIPDLPGNVYLGAPRGTSAASPVLYRVNAGGAALPASDGGPDWLADSGATSQFRTSGSNAATYPAVPAVDGTVPASTPAAIFSTERWDPGTKTDGTEMRWAFPVAAGTTVAVRLYFANQCSCTSAAGQRRFDVAVDGTTYLNDFDIAASAGHRVGTMRTVPVTSDGSVDIAFGHEVDHPLVNGIEIVDAAATGTPGQQAPLAVRSFDGRAAGAAQPVGSDLDWGRVRAPFLVGGTLFYGTIDGSFFRRTFDGTSFGAERAIDPYNDPLWSDVDTGSNNTYRGLRPDFYTHLTQMTAAFYRDGMLYYTTSTSPGLYYRAFSAESGIVRDRVQQVPGVTLPQLTGAFLSGNSLYYGTAADGKLQRVGFTPGATAAPGTLTGPATVVSGPDVDGVDWRARSVFLGPAGNRAPVATPAVTCTGLTCSLDGSASSDSDGSVVSWAWAYGDGSTGTGAGASHTYGSAGDYEVRLTVTDDAGATASTAVSVTVAPLPNEPPAAEVSVACDGLTCSFDATGSTDPDGTVSGYAWNFGDGSTATGRLASHRYAAARDYAGTLTVTDDDGATAARAFTVSPSTPVAGVAFRGVSGTSVLGTSATVTVPDSTQAGDLLVLDVAGAGDSVQTPPTGWSRVAVVAPTAVLTTVWQRTATAEDAGTQVRVTFGAQQKADLTLLAYSGAAAIDPAAAVTKSDAFSAGSHTQPPMTAPAGGTALWFWHVKSSATTALTVPSGTVSRNVSSGSGTGRVTTLVAESAAPVSGTVTGPTAVADGGTTGRTTMVGLVLVPRPVEAPNEVPTAEAAVSCDALACTFDAAGSADPDGRIASYEWDFGDGTRASGPTAAHTYAAAGDFRTTLTVTDDRGAVASREITVSPMVPTPGAVAFRGVAGTSVLGTSASVSVPDSVEAGDLLVLNVAGAGSSAQTAPAGWTSVVVVNPTGVLTTVFQRTATAGDAGTQVRVTFGAQQKADVSLLAYAGAAPLDLAKARTKSDASSGGAHAMPEVVAPRPGSVAVWIWNVKSSATTAISTPDGAVARNVSSGSGTGYVTSLVAESGSPVSGSVTGPTAVADGGTTGRTTMVALVVEPRG